MNHVELAARGLLSELRGALDGGAPVDGENFLNISALGAACMHGRDRCAKLLLDRGAGVEKLSGHAGARPLALAAESGSIKIMKMLVSSGADIEAVSSSGQTALMRASRNGKAAAVAFLTAAGAQVNRLDDQGQSALFLSMCSGSKSSVREAMDCLQMLILAGADLSYRDPRGQTVLHVASMLASASVISTLVAKGCEVDAKDNMGQTPLYAAVQTLSLDQVKALLAAGADPFIKSTLGPSPRSLARGFNTDIMTGVIESEILMRKERKLLAKAAGLGQRSRSSRL